MSHSYKFACRLFWKSGQFPYALHVRSCWWQRLHQVVAHDFPTSRTMPGTPPLKLTQTPSFQTSKKRILHDPSLPSPLASPWGLSNSSSKTAQKTPSFCEGIQLQHPQKHQKAKTMSKLCLLHFGHHAESHEAGRLKREMTNNRSGVSGYSFFAGWLDDQSISSSKKSVGVYMTTVSKPH